MCSPCLEREFRNPGVGSTSRVSSDKTAIEIHLSINEVIINGERCWRQTEIIFNDFVAISMRPVRLVLVVSRVLQRVCCLNLRA
jgi:hypothetical protein